MSWFFCCGANPKQQSKEESQTLDLSSVPIKKPSAIDPNQDYSGLESRQASSIKDFKVWQSAGKVKNSPHTKAGFEGGKDLNLLA